MTPNEKHVARRNWRAAPIDLYDIPSPSAPSWWVVQNAIKEYRLGLREPVML